VPADDRAGQLVDVGDPGFGFLPAGTDAPVGGELDADRVGGGHRAAEEGAELAAVPAFVCRPGALAQPAGDVGPGDRPGFFGRFFGLRRGSRRGAGRAGAGKVLAGDPVVVPVEVVGVAGQQIFLRFGLVGEVGAVVVEGLRRWRRGEQGDRADAQGDEEEETLDRGSLSQRCLNVWVS
jgi:hypothetical protein